MPVRPPRFVPAGQRSKREVQQDSDRRRGSARQRGYSAAWDKASKGFLRSHPFCRYCDEGVFGEVQVSASAVTDHLYPQRTYDGVFWRTEWWVAACQPCHDGPKQALERKGKRALDGLARRLGLPVLGEGEG